MLQVEQPHGVGFIPLVIWGAAALGIPAAAAYMGYGPDDLLNWISPKETPAKEQAPTVTGSIAVKPPPLPAAPQTVADMTGGWSVEKQQQENAKLYAQYVASAPSWVNWTTNFTAPIADDSKLYVSLAAAALGLWLVLH